MILQIEKIFFYLFLLIPLFLITGPAIPDVIITLGIIFGIFYLIYLKKYEKILKTNIFRVSILFWGNLLLISFFAHNKIYSFQDSIIFIRFLLIPIFCYFIFFKSTKKLEQILSIIFILVVLVSLDTLFQFFNYNSESGFGSDLLGFKSNWYGRLTGPFGDELIPGSYITKFGFLGYVYLILNKRFKQNTIIQILYLTMILLVSYVTGERMAFAVFTLGLISLLIFMKGFRKSIFISIVFGFVLIFFVTYLHPFYNDFKVIESTQYHQGLKIEKFYKCNNDSEKLCSKIIDVQPSFVEIIKNFNTSAYGEIYLLSYKMFKDNLLTGIGINNFKYLCNFNQSYKNLMVNYDCASHPHNIYIQWLTEGGLIVFFSFVFYLFFLVKLIATNDGEEKYKVISFVIILTMFWPIMSTGSLIKNWFGIISFFIVGLSMCISKIKNTYQG